MIKVHKVYQLLRTEFEGTRGTELFARMMCNKFHVELPREKSPLELANIRTYVCHLVENNVTDVWFVEGTKSENTLIFYFASSEDACFLSKDVLQLENVK
jgi:hypothetical protein